MTDQKRLFIGIPLPPAVRADLAAYAEEWDDLPVRWIKEEDLHITLVFLGEVPIKALPDVITAMEETAATTAPFSVQLQRIGWGPPGKKPRLIWVDGDGGGAIKSLHQSLAEALHEYGLYNEPPRRFRTHVTVGRLDQRRYGGDRLPDREDKLGLQFTARSLELKESHLGPGGADHVLLEEVFFDGREHV